MHKPKLAGTHEGQIAGTDLMKRKKPGRNRAMNCSCSPHSGRLAGEVARSHQLRIVADIAVSQEKNSRSNFLARAQVDALQAPQASLSSAKRDHIWRCRLGFLLLVLFSLFG